MTTFRDGPFAQIAALIAEIPDELVRLDALADLVEIERVIDNNREELTAQSHPLPRCDRCGATAQDVTVYYLPSADAWTCAKCGVW